MSKDVRLSPSPQAHASPLEVQDYACTLLDSQTSVADTACLSSSVTHVLCWTSSVLMSCLLLAAGFLY